MKSMATFLIFARRVIWMQVTDRVARGENLYYFSMTYCYVYRTTDFF